MREAAQQQLMRRLTSNSNNGNASKRSTASLFGKSLQS